MRVFLTEQLLLFQVISNIYSIIAFLNITTTLHQGTYRSSRVTHHLQGAHLMAPCEPESCLEPGGPGSLPGPSAEGPDSQCFTKTPAV